VLMLVDGETSTIIVGNGNLTRFERLLGAGDEKIGRQILNQHIAAQLMALGSSTTASYSMPIMGVDGAKHVNCNVSAWDRKKVVWSMQGVPQPMQDSQAMQAELLRNHIQKLSWQGGWIGQQALGYSKNEVRPPVCNIPGLNGSIPSWKLENTEQKWSANMELSQTLESGEQKWTSPKCNVKHEPRSAQAVTSISPNLEVIKRNQPPAAGSPAKSINAKGKTGRIKLRRPYRFCSMCWVQKSDWVLRSVTLPKGPSKSLNGHTNDTCPMWPKGNAITCEQNRAYATAFKCAQRKAKLHDIALKAFEEILPDMKKEDLLAYLLT